MDGIDRTSEDTETDHVNRSIEDIQDIEESDYLGALKKPVLIVAHNVLHNVYCLAI